MGKNTPDRQKHMVQNLRIEKDDAEVIANAKAIANAKLMLEDDDAA